MGAGYKRTLTTGSIPVFQISKHPLLAQGGFLLDTTGLTAGSMLMAGHPFLFDEANRTAKPLHVAKIYENAGAAATAYKVFKGHTLIVGDNFALAVDGAAYAITAIDTSNADYDTVTVGTTIGAATAGDHVFASAAAGAAAAAYPATMKGLLYRDIKVDSGESVSVIIGDIVVYARRIPYYSADLEKALSSTFVFSQSK